MKDDQIVRIVAMIGLSASLAIFYALNGSGPIISGFGEISPFAIVAIAQLLCAVPEIADRFPLGPRRKR